MYHTVNNLQSVSLSEFNYTGRVLRDNTMASSGRDKINLDSRELSLIDSGIHSMRDVPLAPHLQSISLHSNYIQRIQGLELLRNLRHLDLSANQIAEISGLDGLVSLKTLNLSCNLISAVEGLSYLRFASYLIVIF